MTNINPEVWIKIASVLMVLLGGTVMHCSFRLRLYFLRKKWRKQCIERSAARWDRLEKLNRLGIDYYPPIGH